MNFSESDAPGARQRQHFKRIVSVAEDSLRIDQYLAAVLPQFSRGFWKKALTTGSVHVDGRRVSQCSRSVRTGQRVEVFLDGLPLEKHLIDARQVLFEDENLLVLNKPAGLDTQPTPSRFQGTLYQGILDYLGRGKGAGRRPEIGMVQRLDRDTSGVIAFSIHPRAHRSLSEQFRQHKIRKTYLALVSGKLENEQGEFKSNLTKIRAINRVRSVARGGKPALTRYRLVQAADGVSLVEVELVTGRMHQIRAHFSEADHPLCGDIRYDGVGRLHGLDIPGQLLHSWRLSLAHPVTGQALELKAPLPADWSPLLEACGFPAAMLRNLVASD